MEEFLCFQKVNNQEMLEDCFYMKESVCRRTRRPRGEVKLMNMNLNLFTLIGYDNEQPVATARIRPINETTVKIGNEWL